MSAAVLRAARRAVAVLAAVAGFAACAAVRHASDGVAGARGGRRPNVVVVPADDLGARTRSQVPSTGRTVPTC